MTLIITRPITAAERRLLRIEEIKNAVAARYGIDPRDLAGKRKTPAELNEARLMALALAHAVTGASLPVIAGAFNRYQRSVSYAATYAWDRVKSDDRRDRAFAATYVEFLKRFREKYQGEGVR